MKTKQLFLTLLVVLMISATNQQNGAINNTGERPTFIIIGDDNRVRVTNTDREPWNSIVDLDISFPAAQYATCTGFFISRRIVATAAHCLYNGETRQWAETVIVYPGRDGGNKRFGSRQVSKTALHIPSEWIANPYNVRYDYGAIILPDDVLGNAVGWFDYGYFNDTYLLSTIGHHAGYPSDKIDYLVPDCVFPGGCQLWYNFDPIIKQEGHDFNYFIHYEIDTFQGQSGGPIWAQICINPIYHYVIGIATHDYGQINNFGTRFTKEIAQFYQALGAPPPINRKPGNANNDCAVDGIDYVIWLNHYDRPTNFGSSDGDFDFNGIVDGIDYVIWLNNYGK
jgi:V8-like Glu-specific endopeptidase